MSKTAVKAAATASMELPDEKIIRAWFHLMGSLQLIQQPSEELTKALEQAVEFAADK